MKELHTKVWKRSTSLQNYVLAAKSTQEKQLLILVVYVLELFLGLCGHGHCSDKGGEYLSPIEITHLWTSAPLVGRSAAPP